MIDTCMAYMEEIPARFGSGSIRGLISGLESGMAWVIWISLGNLSWGKVRTTDHSWIATVELPNTIVTDRGTKAMIFLIKAVHGRS